jgi:hypothetical protein
MENPSDSVIKFGASVMIMVSCTSLTSIVDARYHCKHRLLDLLLSHPLIMRYTSIMFYFAACHIQCQGTVRENRTLKAPLIINRTIQKKSRGYHEICYERKYNACIVKWHDNTSDSMAYNFERPLRLTFCSRWSAKEKRRIQVRSTTCTNSIQGQCPSCDFDDKLSSLY